VITPVTSALGANSEYTLVLAIAGFDPFVWSGRASQEVFVDLADVRSCINVSGL
jgi:hypothetical protein